MQTPAALTVFANTHFFARAVGGGHDDAWMGREKRQETVTIPLPAALVCGWEEVVVEAVVGLTPLSLSFVFVGGRACLALRWLRSCGSSVGFFLTCSVLFFTGYLSDDVDWPISRRISRTCCPTPVVVLFFLCPFFPPYFPVRLCFPATHPGARPCFSVIPAIQTVAHIGVSLQYTLCFPFSWVTS